MLREIVLDTETTGIDHGKGDRVIEIGCVELVNHVPTGKFFHAYINPEFPVSQGAFGVHGLSNEFLADKPVFAAVAETFADLSATPASSSTTPPSTWVFSMRSTPGWDG